MMIGIPGSGKSTMAEQMAKYYLEQECEQVCIVSTDNIREWYCKGEYIKDTNAAVFEIAEQVIRDEMSKGNIVIFDATNLKKKYRTKWIDLAKLQGYRTAACEVQRDVNACIGAMDERPEHRKIPREKIIQFYETMEQAEIDEFDCVSVHEVE